jgi:hypothetical protein
VTLPPSRAARARARAKAKAAAPGQAEWRAAAAAVSRCESCETRRGPFQLHHVIYRAEVRRRRGDQYDVLNGMGLCRSCHENHHARTRPVLRAKIPAAALAFAIRLMGEDAADVYLARRYAAEPTTQEVRSAA